MAVELEDADGWEAVPAPPATSQELQAVQLATDTDGKAECPGCGGRYKVTADGHITGQHKCTGVRQVEGDKPKSTGRAIGGKRGKARTPDKVRQVVGDLVSAGLEWTAAEAISRSVPMPRHAIPAEIVEIESDSMIGPFLDIIWPQLPVKARKTISRIADEGDLILAAFAWMEWQRGIAAYTREARKLVAAQPAPHLASVTPLVMPDMPQASETYDTPKGVPNVFSGQAGEALAGIEFGEPFDPS
jgi:hypothetical protein